MSLRPALLFFLLSAVAVIVSVHAHKPSAGSAKKGSKKPHSHSHGSSKHSHSHTDSKKHTHSHDSHSRSDTKSKKDSTSSSGFGGSPFPFKLPDHPYTDVVLRAYAQAMVLLENNPIPGMAHLVTERLTLALRPLHDLSTERAAVTASLLTSSVSLISIILLPFSGILTTILLPFAAGALLSDLAYHLLPHLYDMRPAPSPLALLLSVALFTLLDAFLRRAATAAAASYNPTASLPQMNNKQQQQPSARNRRGHHQAHSHSHSHSNNVSTNSSSIDYNRADSEKSTARVAAYINLAADALHNFCDGLSLAAAFTASPAAGIATTIAIVLHELPQELADFALLIRAGFGTRRAIFANVLCALTALAGTLVALRASALVEGADANILPFAAGALLYLTFATVIPDVVADLVAPSTRKLGGKTVQVPVSFFRFLMRLFVASLSASAGVAIVALVESVHAH